MNKRLITVCCAVICITAGVCGYFGANWVYAHQHNNQAASAPCADFNKLDSARIKQLALWAEVSDPTDFGTQVLPGMTPPPGFDVNPTTCALEFGYPFPKRICTDFSRLTEEQQIGLTDLVALYRHRYGTAATPTDNEAVINPVSCRWGFGIKTPDAAVFQYYLDHPSWRYDPSCKPPKGDLWQCGAFPGTS